MTFLAQIADRVLNRPLLITPDKAQVIVSVLGGRIGAGSPETSRFEGEPHGRDDRGAVTSVKPYRVSGGVATVTITGSLVNRGAWIGASSGLTSYEGIRHQLKTAKDDADVSAVILDLSTPGGEAIGAMETSEAVRDLAAVKRTVAVVNGMACSAGYAIASGASEIVTTETGVSGSIGVVLLHADFSRSLELDGVKPTLIFAGAHKVDGNPFEPLPPEVRDDLQAEVDAFYGAFTRTVASGRGRRLSEAAARATEARTFVGASAVSAGLADRVGSFDAVLFELSSGAQGGRRQPSPQRRSSMSENTPAPAASAGFTQSDLDAARTEGREAGATAERERIQALASADGVKGNAARLSAALDLAAQSPGMSADRIVAFVAANVPEGASASASSASLERRAEVPDSLAAAASGQKPGGADASAGWGKVSARINTMNGA